MEEEKEKQEMVSEDKSLQETRGKDLSITKEEELPEGLAQILNDLPEEKRDVIRGAMVHLEQRSFSGPLPHPELFEGYERTLPGAANRIMTMSEKEQEHRHQIEIGILKQKCKKQNRGQLYGCGLAVFFAVVAFALALMGHEIIASVIFGTTIIAVLIIYVLGVVPNMKKNESKNETDTEEERE